MICILENIYENIYTSPTSLAKCVNLKFNYILYVF